MTLRIHATNEVIDITTAINISTEDIYKQLDEGNLIVLDTIYGTTFIINCININAIEIINNNMQK